MPPAGYRRRLERYRHGPGVFKMDWALRAPVPWRATECARAGTLHLGGTLEKIASGERSSWNGTVPERPYVPAVQPSMFDRSRAPAGRHTLWAYCHVPHGAAVDMMQAIEDQIERYAAGFRDCISTRHSAGPAAMEQRNANLIGDGRVAGVVNCPEGTGFSAGHARAHGPPSEVPFHTRRSSRSSHGARWRRT